jgi:hypothetical protein
MVVLFQMHCMMQGSECLMMSTDTVISTSADGHAHVKIWCNDNITKDAYLLKYLVVTNRRQDSLFRGLK